jgi:hypothetical protein
MTSKCERVTLERGKKRMNECGRGEEEKEAGKEIRATFSGRRRALGQSVPEQVEKGHFRAPSGPKAKHAGQPGPQFCGHSGDAIERLSKRGAKASGRSTIIIDRK